MAAWLNYPGACANHFMMPGPCWAFTPATGTGSNGTNARLQSGGPLPGWWPMCWNSRTKFRWSGICGTGVGTDRGVGGLPERTDVQRLIDLLDRVKLACHLTDAELAAKAGVSKGYITELRNQRYTIRGPALTHRSDNYQRVEATVERMAAALDKTARVEAKAAPRSILDEIVRARQANQPVFGRSWGGAEPLDLLLGHIAHLEEQTGVLTRALRLWVDDDLDEVE